MDALLKIINFLAKDFNQASTMHGLAIKLSIPYTTLHRTVASMQDLLLISRVGRAKTIRLDLKKQIITSYLAIASEEEKKAFIARQPTIRIISKELQTKDVVLLFGSYAKGEETKHSDIDIMVINKSGKRTIDFSKHELIFRKEINTIFFKESEFKAMLKSEEENVGKQAVRQHIILKNSSGFWQLVQDALRKTRI